MCALIALLSSQCEHCADTSQTPALPVKLHCGIYPSHPLVNIKTVVMGCCRPDRLVWHPGWRMRRRHRHTFLQFTPRSRPRALRLGEAVGQHRLMRDLRAVQAARNRASQVFRAPTSTNLISVWTCITAGPQIAFFMALLSTLAVCNVREAAGLQKIFVAPLMSIGTGCGIVFVLCLTMDPDVQLYIDPVQLSGNLASALL